MGECLLSNYYSAFSESFLDPCKLSTRTHVPVPTLGDNSGCAWMYSDAVLVATIDVLPHYVLLRNGDGKK